MLFGLSFYAANAEFPVSDLFFKRLRRAKKVW